MSAAGAEPFRLLVIEHGRCFRIEIPAASPLFEGHFPGHPILPGIAHLAFVERAVGPLAAVRSLKLRRPVLPGDVLDLSTGSLEADDEVRFELRRGDEAVSNGVVQRNPSADREPADVDLPPSPGFPPLEALLPHAPPARFIRGVLTAAEEEIVCVAEIPSLHPLVEGDGVPAFAGIEAAAQAAAILEALNRRSDAPGPRIGYLVGAREARFAVLSLAVGRPLRVSARLQGGAFPLSIYEIAVGEPGRELVTGMISTFIAPTRDG
jgi:predicted hotdog family 3-hydroxylacyl-ACP dehydratase